MSSITVERRSMIRRKPVYDASRGDLTEHGATAKDAKAALDARIDAALVGSYVPHLVTYRDLTALVFREPTGWTYTILREESGADGVFRPTAIQGTRDSRNEVIQSAAHHVIQNVCGPDDIWEDADIPSFLTDVESRRNLITTSRFQRAHRWATDNGIEGDLHRWSCDHADDPQFVNRPPTV
jgi:hypothetical protein